MSEQWLHKYVLEFGQPVSFYAGDTNLTTNPPSGLPRVSTPSLNFYENKVGYADSVDIYQETATDGLRITGLNITFRINKSKEGSKESTITLYNISKETRKYLEAKQGNKASLSLWLGYQSDKEVPLAFYGEVIGVKERKEGAVNITELLLMSSASNSTEAYTSRSYRSGADLRTIINDVIKDLKLPKGTVNLLANNDVPAIITKSVVIAGSSKDFLKRFCAANGYRFWIEDGCANVSPLQPQPDGAVAFLISSSTNMIGSPTLANESTVMEKQAATRQDVRVKTTLNGAYSIGAKVQLESLYHNGVYEIVGITHSGTYEGSEWFSDLELKPIDGWEKAK